MENVIDGTKALLGRGKVFFDPWDANNQQTGFMFLGETPEFKMSPSQEEMKLYSHTTAQARLMASDVVRSECALSIVAAQFNKELLALALFGTLDVLTQSAGTATAEPHDGVLQGRSYRLTYRKATSVVVKDATPTTYTLTEDYTVNAEMGMIFIVPGGDIVDGTDLLVDYSYAAITGMAMVNLGAEGVKRGTILFIPDNARGPQMEHTLWRVTLRASGDINFIGDDYGKFTLDGYVEDDSANPAHPNAPYGITVYQTGG